MTPFELAQRYYPRLWSRERIETLIEAGRLTRAQADKVMGEASNLAAGSEAEE